MARLEHDGTIGLTDREIVSQSAVVKKLWNYCNVLSAFVPGAQASVTTG